MRLSLVTTSKLVALTIDGRVRSLVRVRNVKDRDEDASSSAEGGKAGTGKTEDKANAKVKDGKEKEKEKSGKKKKDELELMRELDTPDNRRRFIKWGGLAAVPLVLVIMMGLGEPQYADNKGIARHFQLPFEPEGL
jgi:hypothetical protein